MVTQGNMGLLEFITFYIKFASRTIYNLDKCYATDYQRKSRAS